MYASNVLVSPVPHIITDTASDDVTIRGGTRSYTSYLGNLQEKHQGTRFHRGSVAYDLHRLVRRPWHAIEARFRYGRFMVYIQPCDRLTWDHITRNERTPSRLVFLRPYI